MNKYKVISITLAVVIVLVVVISYSPKEYRKINPFYSCSATYVSGTGTAGTANTAQTIITRTIPANTLTQVGDRIRIRVYFFANSGTPIIITVKVNGISTANITQSSASIPSIAECDLHYIDNTHANILEQDAGVLGSLSAVNVAGFSWNSNTDIVVSQSAMAGNFLTVYGVFVDILPKYAV